MISYKVKLIVNKDSEPKLNNVLEAERYVFNDLHVGTVLVTLSGDIIGMDDNAKRIGSELKWNIK